MKIFHLCLLMLAFSLSCTSSKRGNGDRELFGDVCKERNVRYDEWLEEASKNKEEIVKRCGFPFPKGYLEKIESYHAVSSSPKVPKIEDEIVLVRWWNFEEKRHICKFRGTPPQKLSCEELLPILFPERNCVLSPDWLNSYVYHLCGNMGISVPKP